MGQPCWKQNLNDCERCNTFLQEKPLHNKQNNTTTLFDMIKKLTSLCLLHILTIGIARLSGRFMTKKTAVYKRLSVHCVVLVWLIYLHDSCVILRQEINMVTSLVTKELKKMLLNFNKVVQEKKKKNHDASIIYLNVQVWCRWLIKFS